jgi:RND family efflux transporter MFP subunit
LGIFGAVAIVAALMLVISGIRAREDTNVKLREWTDSQAVPPVAVIYAEPGALTATIDLPGRLEAYNRAPIFARVNGYLKYWNADIGARVKSGEVIAEIDAPDLDQQLLQARADLANQQASAKLSEVTLARRKTLIASNFVSMQEIDERTADLSNKNAAVNSGQANVERLEALARYKKITAPFDGIVTARSTDVGALINAGGGSGPPMFVVSDIRKLRVYVNVPQNYVPSVPPGTQATIRVPEHPDKTYSGTVQASAQAVNASTGTTLMQLIVDNNAGEMMPGDYASIHLQIADAGQVLRVPSSALIFDAKGLSVATVDANNRVLVKPVSIARDLGAVVELASGLALNDRVIENPPDGVGTGTAVRLNSPDGSGNGAKVRVAGAATDRSDAGKAKNTYEKS